MPRFKAFISYKHFKSSQFAENLELAIKAYAKPIYRPPIAVFRDEKYLRPGADLPLLISNALNNSEFLIYLASPQAAASDWVRTELEQWCADEERRGRLIIVLTDGKVQSDMHTKRVDWALTDAVPRSLADKIQFEPFYVDLSWARREEQQTLLDPDYKKAINGIVAALCNIDPIELSGQEIIQHRRNIRIRNAFIGAISALSVLLAVAAVIAFVQWQLAEQRRKEALSRQLTAQAELTRVQTADQLPQSVLVAFEALRVAPLPETRPVLNQSIEVQLSDSPANLLCQ